MREYYWSVPLKERPGNDLQYHKNIIISLKNING